MTPSMEVVAQVGHARAVTVFVFEGIDDTLDLLPLAARRALDRAGVKVSLSAWRTLPLAARRAIVDVGADDVVDASAVRAQLGDVEQSPVSPDPEPDPERPPAPVAQALPEWDPARWASLRPFARWSIASLARRERHDALRALIEELGGATELSRPPPEG